MVLLKYFKKKTIQLQFVKIIILEADHWTICGIYSPQRNMLYGTTLLFSLDYYMIHNGCVRNFLEWCCQPTSTTNDPIPSGYSLIYSFAPLTENPETLNLHKLIIYNVHSVPPCATLALPAMCT